MIYDVKEASTFLFSILDEAKNIFGRSDIWWRGHTSSGYSLLPGIHRRSDGKIIEQQLSMEFRRKATPRHHNCPPIYDNCGWLFLMQHYRLPTRLLDWSESLLVATYFTVNNSFDKAGALWALSPYFLNENQFGEKCVFEPEGPPMQPLIRHAFDKTAQEIPKIAAISTREIDIRMMAQLSTMTIHGNREPLEMTKGNELFLKKFEIPAGIKKDLSDFLFELGIRESNLFPDLEHLAQDIANGYYATI